MHRTAVAALAAYNKNPNSFVILSVENGARKALQHVNPPDLARWHARTWQLDQQICSALELVKEATGKLEAACLAIDARGFEKVELSASM